MHALAKRRVLEIVCLLFLWICSSLPKTRLLFVRSGQYVFLLSTFFICINEVEGGKRK